MLVKQCASVKNPRSLERGGCQYAFTESGVNQLGSGFYLTTDRAEAMGYAVSRVDNPLILKFMGVMPVRNQPAMRP